jgi:hypothetical protein
MEHQNQDESGEKNTAVRLNKEIVLPTTDTGGTACVTRRLAELERLAPEC